MTDRTHSPAQSAFLLIVLIAIFAIICGIVLLAQPATAQTPAAAAPVVTVEQVQADKADLQVQLAKANAQIHALKFELSLYEKATGRADAEEQDNQALVSAQQAAQAAHAKVPAPLTPPAK